jgi:hypothetical protein
MIVPGCLRSAWLWVAASIGLAVTSLGVVVYGASIRVPPIGCTVPQPPAKQIPYDRAIDHISHIASVANWFAIAALGCVLLGLAPARRRLPLLIVAMLLILLAIGVAAEGNELRNQPFCTPG